MSFPTPPPVLLTPRLELRPLTLEDAAATQRLYPHWKIVRYLSDRTPWPYPPDGALSFYRDVALPAMARGEACHWSLRRHEAPGELIGAINLRDDEAGHRGFWLGLDWHGQGLMSEACVAVTDYWFETLGRPLLRVSKAVPNIASSRISEKAGMRLVGIEIRSYVAGSLPTEIWEMTRAEWEAARRR